MSLCSIGQCTALTSSHIYQQCAEQAASTVQKVQQNSFLPSPHSFSAEKGEKLYWEMAKKQHNKTGYSCLRGKKGLPQVQSTLRISETKFIFVL